MSSKGQKPRLLVIQVAALGHDFARAAGLSGIGDLRLAPLEPPFPAVTATVQASFRTALPPARHGMTANGYFDPRLQKVFFWEQSASLVEGPRIWQDFRAAGGRVAMLFWQQSLGEEVDLVLSPAPIHKHHGGIIDACYSHPASLARRLASAVGRRFRLRDYWGPLASVKASAWIARATGALLADPDMAPDLCLTYLPGLDYDLLRYGPSGARSRHSLCRTVDELRRLLELAGRHGYETVVFGDYAIGASNGGAVFPNRCLRAGGWFNARRVGRRSYPDLNSSRAVAVVDHEVAHVHVAAPEDIRPVAEMLAGLPGVGEVLDRTAMQALGVDHPRSGQLMLVAAPGRWFAYPWWDAEREAPDFAGRVDIHNKPGFDPCELFFGWPPGSVTRRTERVGGSHGRVGAGREAVWAASCFAPERLTLLELAGKIKHLLQPEE